MLDLRPFTGVTTMTAMFATGMTALKTLYFPPNITNSAGSDARYVKDDAALRLVVMGTAYERMKRYAFQVNTSGTQFVTVYIGDAVNGSELKSINSYNTLVSVKNLVIYATTPPYWHNNDSSFAKDTGSKGNSTLPAGTKVYVPDSAVDTYKNSGADMWGNFASRIYPISEFEGEL